MPLLEARNLHKTFRRGEQSVHALRGVSLALEQGEVVAVVGPSGCGKSTLLHLLGGLDEPSAGEVRLDGELLTARSERALAALRRRKLGFVFQFFHLMPTLSAVENVALPLLLDGVVRRRALDKARALLSVVGLEGRVEHLPAQLSGGEMQRVAIARALCAEPRLVLADEPTGNLDSEGGALVLELLRRTVRERRLALVLVTHDERAAAMADRIVRLRDGCVEGAGATPAGATVASGTPGTPGTPPRARADG